MQFTQCLGGNVYDLRLYPLYLDENFLILLRNHFEDIVDFPVD